MNIRKIKHTLIFQFPPFFYNIQEHLSHNATEQANTQISHELKHQVDADEKEPLMSMYRNVHVKFSDSSSVSERKFSHTKFGRKFSVFGLGGDIKNERRGIIPLIWEVTSI